MTTDTICYVLSMRSHRDLADVLPDWDRTQEASKPCSGTDVNHQATPLKMSSFSLFTFQITSDDNFTFSKDGPIHKLLITKCTEEHSGKYRFEADGRKTEAMINVKGLRICNLQKTGRYASGHMTPSGPSFRSPEDIP